MTKAESRAISKCEALEVGIYYADFQAPEDSPASPEKHVGHHVAVLGRKPILTFSGSIYVASPNHPKIWI